MKVAIECFVLAPGDVPGTPADGPAAQELQHPQDRPIVARQLPSYQVEGPPTQAVRLLLSRFTGRKPLLVHSTSWRHDDPTRFVFTTFVALYAEPVNVGSPIEPVAFDGPHEALSPDKPEIVAGHALHHGLRHLSFLSNTDEEVQRALVVAGIVESVRQYHPEPAGDLRIYAA